MGFRFRRSISILPGIRINLGKRGASLSIGKPGASINISSKGVRGTVGIPGTGLSYSTKLSGASRSKRQSATQQRLDATYETPTQTRTQQRNKPLPDPNTIGQTESVPLVTYIAIIMFFLLIIYALKTL